MSRSLTFFISVSDCFTKSTYSFSISNFKLFFDAFLSAIYLSREISLLKLHKGFDFYNN